MVSQAREIVNEVYTYLIVFQYNSKIRIDRQPYITIDYQHGEKRKQKAKKVKGDEIPVKKRGIYGTKKCNCISRWTVLDINCIGWEAQS